MEGEELLRQLQEELEDDDNDLLAYQLLQQMKNSIDHLMDTQREHGESRPGERSNIDQDRYDGHHRIFKDYFATEPTYPNYLFRRRFRMRKGLFLRIMDAISAYDPYVQQKRDATGLLELSTIQKTTTAIRMLAYGMAANATDEYCWLGESTAIKSFKRFLKAIRSLYEIQYLGQPNRADIENQMEINRSEGSLECLHRWTVCIMSGRIALLLGKGNLKTRMATQSIIFEVVADQPLHIWHAFFGLPGANNEAECPRQISFGEVALGRASGRHDLSSQWHFASPILSIGR